MLNMPAWCIAKYEYPARGQQVPDRVANYITVTHAHPQTLLTGKEEIRFRFGTQDRTAFHNHRLTPDPKDIQ